MSDRSPSRRVGLLRRPVLLAVLATLLMIAGSVAGLLWYKERRFK